MGRKSKKEGISVYMWLSPFAAQLNLTYHCKAPIVQLKERKKQTGVSGENSRYSEIFLGIFAVGHPSCGAYIWNCHLCSLVSHKRWDALSYYLFKKCALFESLRMLWKPLQRQREFEWLFHGWPRQLSDQCQVCGQFHGSVLTSRHSVHFNF